MEWIDDMEIAKLIDLVQGTTRLGTVQSTDGIKWDGICEVMEGRRWCKKLHIGPMSLVYMVYQSWPLVPDIFKHDT